MNENEATEHGDSSVSTFGPDDAEWCPVGKPEDGEEHMHCSHWSDCEPCCRCGDDTPDPNCDCPRCTYVRQETVGYGGELRERPDLDAPWPSGMCGTKRSCDRCPSSFLCSMKARAELDHIRGIFSGWDAIASPRCPDCGQAIADVEQHARWHADENGREG